MDNSISYRDLFLHYYLHQLYELLPVEDKHGSKISLLMIDIANKETRKYVNYLMEVTDDQYLIEYGIDDAVEILRRVFTKERMGVEAAVSVT